MHTRHPITSRNIVVHCANENCSEYMRHYRIALDERECDPVILQI